MDNVFQNIEEERKKIIKDKFTSKYFINKFEPLKLLRDEFNKSGEYDYCLEDLRRIVDSYLLAVASAKVFFEKLPSVKIPYEFDTANEKFFFYFMDDSFSRLYSVWNRIGNFINLFFKVIKDKKIYFEKVIDFLNHSPHSQTLEFKWLIDYREKESKFKKILKKRHPIIHNEISYSSFYKKFIEIAGANNNSIQNLNKEREKIKEDLKFLIDSFEDIDSGIDKIIKFIEDSFKNTK